MTISDVDKKMLWGRSGLLCACDKAELMMGDRIIGEMAHIVAQSEQGPRGHSKLDQEERDSYGNLILLCPKCHTMIDKDPDTWSVEKLLEMKREHEAWVLSRLAQGAVWQRDFLGIHYVNFFRLLCELSIQGIFMTVDGLDVNSVRSLRGLGWKEMLYVIEVVKECIPVWRPHAVDLFNDITDKNIGNRVKFEAFFKRKNGAALYSKSYTWQGDIEKDPHIHCKVDKREAYFPLDPCWVTTNTAFSAFEDDDDVKLAGLGVIKQITNKRILVSPLIIGIPMGGWGSDNRST